MLLNADSRQIPLKDESVLDADFVQGLAAKVHLVHPLDAGRREPSSIDRTVWTIATQPWAKAHYATFPEALVKRCVLAGCPSGGLVLDPFVGSGTTVRVARSLGRHGIGLDLNFDYLHDQALERTRVTQGFSW